MTLIRIAHRPRDLRMVFLPVHSPDDLVFCSALVGGPVGFYLNQFIFPLAQKFKFPRLQRFIVERVPYKRGQELIEVSDIMHKTSIEIIKAKKMALASLDPEVAAEIANKKDIISILSLWLSFTLLLYLIVLTIHLSASQ